MNLSLTGGAALCGRHVERVQPRLRGTPVGVNGMRCYAPGMHELSALLQSLYGTTDALPRLAALIDKWRAPIAAASAQSAPGFDQTTAVLIAYPDHLQRDGEAPLRTLADWCGAHWRGLLSTVHVLPFHPSSSYEGYAITNYRTVDDRLGSWSDLARLRAAGFELMTDLVLNHCSQQHPWFQQFLRDEEPGRRYFIVADDPDAAWLRDVHRARTSPLLSSYGVGATNVWTTYDRDLVDLDWSEPDVALEMIDVLLESAARGMRVVRLDAFVYTWKAPHTTCVNQPQVRTILALLRASLDAAGATSVALLPSLTNVTQAEAFTYLRDEDAQLIYHLPLSALLLHAVYTHDASTLAAWLRALPAAPPGKAYLNLTACHDGIGLTWLRDVLPPAAIASLISEAVARGSLVSSRRQTADGALDPWEINATYFSACGEDVDAFLATQSVLLALRGVPALYATSLLAGRNDHARVASTNDNRAINRGRFDAEEWQRAVADPLGPQLRVLRAVQSLLRTRAASAAFHPEAAQRILDVEEPSVLAIERTALDGSERALCVTSFADAPVAVHVDGKRYALAPYASLWTVR
jgi:sucrose phosphorylase